MAQSLTPAAVLALLAFAVLPSCRSTPSTPPTATAGLRIQVTKTSYSARNNRLTVRADMWNDHEQDVAFEFGKIRLLVAENESSAKPGALRVSKLKGLQAKTKTEMDLDFDLSAPLANGTYTIEMRDLKKGDAPLGEKAVFQVVVNE